MSTSSAASSTSSAPPLAPAVLAAVLAAVFLAAAVRPVDFVGAAAASAVVAVPAVAFFAVARFAVVPLLDAPAAAGFAAVLLAAVLLTAGVLPAGAAFSAVLAAGAALVVVVVVAAGLAAALVARAVVVVRAEVAATARFDGTLTWTSTPASSSARRTALRRDADRVVRSNASRTSSPLSGRTEPADISCWMAGSENSEGRTAPEREGVVEPVDTDTDYLSRPRHATSTPIEVARESMPGMEGSFLGTLGGGRERRAGGSFSGSCASVLRPL